VIANENWRQHFEFLASRVVANEIEPKTYRAKPKEFA
jgi:hypothetical protein